MKPTKADIAAITRLLDVAERDTGQSRKCADFLLAWWNAEELGGWSPTDLWGVDAEIARDMLSVITLIATWRNYPSSLPDDLVLRFRSLVAVWRDCK